MRKYTNKLLELLDEGIISHKTVAEMCLSYMSEYEVEDMCRSNDVLMNLDDEEE